MYSPSEMHKQKFRYEILSNQEVIDGLAHPTGLAVTRHRLEVRKSGHRARTLCRPYFGIPISVWTFVAVQKGEHMAFAIATFSSQQVGRRKQAYERSQSNATSKHVLKSIWNIATAPPRPIDAERRTPISVGAP